MNICENTVIKTTKTIYPQIYAYVLPEYKPNEGWIKIGYTEHKNVDERIRQQTHTAGIAYSKLWSEPAKFSDTDEWFIDKQLHAYLRRFKKIKQRPNNEWFYYDGTPGQAHADFDDFRHKKLSQAGKELEYKLRAEQEAAVKMTLDYAATHQGGELLWNAKPRFGKTLTTYDFANRMKAQKVLIVTNRPAIANSWFDDFETFIAWQTNYRFVSTTDTLKERPVLTREQFNTENLEKPDGEHLGCVAFISLQDLKGAISFGGSIKKLKWVKDLKWDLLVIDEAHEGVDTFKTDVAFNNINRDFTLHLSGTPFKAVASGRFSGEQIFNWTYADEQDAKAAWPEDIEENNPYEGLPRLNLFSYQMSRMITDEVNKGAEIDGKDIDFAFDLNEFFATGDNGKFIHEAEVKKWLDTLTRNEKYPFSTPELRAELKHTFWLLNRVASAKALEKLLREHPVFENYEVVLAAGDGRTDEDDPIANQKSLNRVKAAIKAKDKTITLSVGQLTTGVTVPEWTAVMMLSNLKSPSLYMQASFRAQNQWSYNVSGEKHRKQNAYVFDFAPERTLIIYDEFANNLNSKTVDGGGSTDDREANIRKLLNFFPVIAEDNDGKMVELDVRQVLTIPKTIKAQEVVKRGFMSNLLFQNISGIFASTEAREILEQLNPVAPGKVTPGQASSPIDMQDIAVDDDGNAVVDTSIVVAVTDARFGEKVYADVAEAASKTAEQESSILTGAVATAFTHKILDTAMEIAKDNSVTVAQAEQVVKQNANVLAREVEIVKKQAEIKQAEATVEYKREVAAAANDESAVAEAKARYETTKQEITETLKQELVDKVEEKAKELTQKSTEDILQKGEEKKRATVEDDIRARLRGFARTIPSFLMAYGEPTTALANFDANIKDEVFKEVTGNKANFETMDSLGIVSLTVEEAGEAVNDKTRTILNSPISDVLIAAVSAGGGVGIDFAVISLIAGKSFRKLGMPAILHVLKIIGQGSAKRGMLFLAIPVALLGLGGNMLAKYINKNQLKDTKERLLQEAVEKLHAIIEAQKAETNAVKARADELSRLNLMLRDFIKKLREDLGDSYEFGETWTLQGRLKNVTEGPDYFAQGFAVGTDYCYSVNVDNDDENHKLYRKNMNNSSDAELMTGTGTIDSLGHSNDMTLATYTESGGTVHRYLYVVANGGTITNSYIVKLEYSGTTYWQVARYNLGAVYTSISRVKYYNNANNEPMVQFLLRSGNYGYYTASVRRAQTGTYSLSTTHRFNVTRPSAYTSYNNQGIHYENDTLYVPLFGYNSNATPNPNKPKENVILVYGGIDNAIANTQIDSISNSKAVTIEAVNTDISLFEIESIGFPVNNPNLNNDLLWFNTNKKIGVDRVNGGIYCDSQDIK